MSLNSYTNQELLSELGKRLTNFTQDELHILLAIIRPCQERILKIVQETYPEIHSLIRKEQAKLEKEKIDKVLNEEDYYHNLSSDEKEKVDKFLAKHGFKY